MSALCLSATRRALKSGVLPPHSKARKKVVDNENVNNYHRTIIRTYSGAHAGTPVPASLELLFRLAGIHVLLILDLSGSIKLFGTSYKFIQD
jgi:hypothetical protein